MDIVDIFYFTKRARRTVASWKDYRQRTGKWPVKSMLAHAGEIIGVAVLGVWLVIYAVDRHWSQWRFVWVFVLVLVPYVLLWSWVEDRAKLSELRHRTNPTKRGRT